MTFTHEVGHIVGGVCCGGKLENADLLPWHLPYSIFNPNPYPLVTLWCGPVLGVLVPVLIAWLSRSDWLWFIANFCILANGSYLAAAWYVGDAQLDTSKLLQSGAYPISIAIYCLLTISIGYIGFRRSCIRVLKAKPTTEQTESSHAPRANEHTKSPPTNERQED